MITAKSCPTFTALDLTHLPRKTVPLVIPKIVVPKNAADLHRKIRMSSINVKQNGQIQCKVTWASSIPLPRQPISCRVGASITAYGQLNAVLETLMLAEAAEGLGGQVVKKKPNAMLAGEHGSVGSPGLRAIPANILRQPYLAAMQER